MVAPGPLPSPQPTCIFTYRHSSNDHQKNGGCETSKTEQGNRWCVRESWRDHDWWAYALLQIARTINPQTLRLSSSMNHLFIWKDLSLVHRIHHMKVVILKWWVAIYRRLKLAFSWARYRQDIVIPPTYPFQPVKMKFITKVYHPNVSSASGAICLDILKDAWSPVLTLKSTLISLQSLLCSPEPNDPQDAEVAKHYTTSKGSFDETARYWTQIYAGGPEPKGKTSEKAQLARDEIAMAGLERAHVDQFEAIGFERSKVVRTLLFGVLFIRCINQKFWLCPRIDRLMCSGGWTIVAPMSLISQKIESLKNYWNDRLLR